MQINPRTTHQIPDNITVGEDGRLVLVGGRHNVANMFKNGSPVASNETIRIFVDNHDRRTAYTRDRGISYSQWVFPDPILFGGAMKQETFRSIFEASLPPAGRPSGIEYPISVLDGHPDRQSRTDSHYSWIGGMYLAAEVARKTLSLDPTDELHELYEKVGEPEIYTGDLGVQCRPVISEYRARPPRLHGIRSASNGVAAGNMGIIQLVTSEKSKTERTLLIFGDSFFRSLLPELARYWRTIVFCRTQFFHDEMVSAVRPDDILSGLAERYFATTEPDSKRPHFLAYPLLMGRSMSPDEGFSALWGELVDSHALAMKSDP